MAIPELGKVTVQARACGSVYRASLKADGRELTLVDEDGMRPTARL